MRIGNTGGSGAKPPEVILRSHIEILGKMGFVRLYKAMSLWGMCGLATGIGNNGCLWAAAPRENFGFVLLYKAISS